MLSSKKLIKFLNIYSSNFIHVVYSALLFRSGGFLDETAKSAILTFCAIFVAFCVATNLYSCTHIFKALMFPQRKHLQKAISSLETVKSEGFMVALRSEVLLMIDMVGTATQRCFRFHSSLRGFL